LVVFFIQKCDLLILAFSVWYLPAINHHLANFKILNAVCHFSLCIALFSYTVPLKTNGVCVFLIFSLASSCPPSCLGFHSMWGESAKLFDFAKTVVLALSTSSFPFSGSHWGGNGGIEW
jgi:hypothetical protein